MRKISILCSWKLTTRRAPVVLFITCVSFSRHFAAYAAARVCWHIKDSRIIVEDFWQVFPWLLISIKALTLSRIKWFFDCKLNSRNCSLLSFLYFSFISTCTCKLLVQQKKRAFSTNWVKCAIFMSFLDNFPAIKFSFESCRLNIQQAQFSINKRPQNQYLRFVCHLFCVSWRVRSSGKTSIDIFGRGKFNEKTSRLTEIERERARERLR